MLLDFYLTALSYLLFYINYFKCLNFAEHTIFKLSRVLMLCNAKIAIYFFFSLVTSVIYNIWLNFNYGALYTQSITALDNAIKLDILVVFTKKNTRKVTRKNTLDVASRHHEKKKKKDRIINKNWTTTTRLC